MGEDRPLKVLWDKYHTWFRYSNSSHWYYREDEDLQIKFVEHPERGFLVLYSDREVGFVPEIQGTKDDPAKWIRTAKALALSLLASRFDKQ